MITIKYSLQGRNNMLLAITIIVCSYTAIISIIQGVVYWLKRDEYRKSKLDYLKYLANLNCYEFDSYNDYFDN